MLLQPGEQDALLATLRAAVPQLPLVMGLSAASTHDAVARARALSRLQPDGLLGTPPLYVRPSQDGIRRHLEAVTESADLPVLVYN
ncbi:dihydrodipicolinate synthase family protein, partial [Acinetobacter baumannii]